MTAPRLPENWLPAHVRRVMETLEAAGHQAHVVGGSVRDALLGRTAHDFDVATDARPERVMELFERTAPTGVRHGTVTVWISDEPVEVTTYRIDLGYSDGRRPDAVHFTDDLTADLARRDFTVNAMAVDLRGHLVDPFGGLTDLSERRIRAVGDPSERFHEDGLRILRALRFAAQLDFAIEPDTLSAMRTHAAKLKAVSLERVGAEWLRIASAAWWRIAPWLAEGPWLSVWPDPLARWQDAFAEWVRRGRHEHWAALTAAVATDDEMRLLWTISIWNSAASLVPGDIRRIGRMLAWPRRFGDALADVLHVYQTHPEQWTTSDWRLHLWQYGFRPVRLAAALVDGWAQEQRPASLLVEADRYIATQPLWSLHDLAVNGRDLMALGLSGPEIGHALQELARLVVLGEAANDRAHLLREARRFHSSCRRSPPERKAERRDST